MRSVLVANRGEIVVRICRTLAARGVRSVAVYAPDDADALHVRVADRAEAVTGYLDPDALVAAARRAGADAVHPGYGFLSEDAAFARAVRDAGLTWIGPPPEAIEAMGDKIRAKETVAAAGVPVVPGAGRPTMTDAELEAAALEVGLPVLLKPAAGGGGKGMRRVTEPGDLPASIAVARREAEGAFGDGTLLVERWVERPRHIEVQVFADCHGNVVHLGERECSLQRRHQKIVEESPSPFLAPSTRAAMTASAVAAARACGYVGAGTVEFIVSGDRPDEYFFMEMNTRLQVEHPVTEAVTGVDLVDWQLQVASGEALPLSQDEIAARGHAVEARVYAEDPARGFLPSTGTVVWLAEPDGLSGVRVDSGICRGAVVGTRYDPMLAKIVAWGETRTEALARLVIALGETSVLGLTTNVGYLRRLLGHADVAQGRLDTGLVERTLEDLATPHLGDAEDAAIAAACRVALDLEPHGPLVDPWEVPDGWRVGGPATWALPVRVNGEARALGVRGRVRDGAALTVTDGVPSRVVARGGDGADLWVTRDGACVRWQTARAGDDVWVGRDGDAWRVSPDRAARGEAPGAALRGGPVTSPMPGVVVAVHVGVGEQVRAGQPLVAVEAMKMEHSIVAPFDGTVRALWARPGQTVALDEPLADVEEGSTASHDADGRADPAPGEG